MEGETKQLKALIVVAAILCAMIIGYNAFFVPDASGYQYFAASQAEIAVDSGADKTAMIIWDMAKPRPLKKSWIRSRESVPR